MKKFLNLSMFYAITAMIGGVFYREFTKWNNFSGVTILGKVHAHLFILGMFLFLLVALFSSLIPIEREKSFHIFMKVYNIGLPLTALMMVIRGIIQVNAIGISKGLNASISGVAGIGHLLIGLGLVMLIISLKSFRKFKDNFVNSSI